MHTGHTTLRRRAGRHRPQSGLQTGQGTPILLRIPSPKRAVPGLVECRGRALHVFSLLTGRSRRSRSRRCPRRARGSRSSRSTGGGRGSGRTGGVRSSRRTGGGRGSGRTGGACGGTSNGRRSETHVFTFLLGMQKMAQLHIRRPRRSRGKTSRAKSDTGNAAVRRTPRKSLSARRTDGRKARKPRWCYASEWV